LLAEAAAQHAATKCFVGRFTWLSYAAAPWSTLEASRRTFAAADQGLETESLCIWLILSISLDVIPEPHKRVATIGL
jgi:hypothetical protein